jgi:uncharacterized protein (TIGR03067 family)
MRSRFMLLLVVLLFAPIPGAADDKQKDDPTKEEMKKLQGIWQVTKFIDHSEEAAPADEIKEFTFEFQGDRLTVRKRKDSDGNQNKYTLDPSKKPKWIDIGESEAIYKLEGDELTFCVVGATNSKKPTPRPSEFKAKKDQHSLFVLKKIKK